MRTTINIDADLLARASRLAGPLDRSTLLSEGLKALIERESAKRLARLGGTQRDLRAAPRARPTGVQGAAKASTASTTAATASAAPRKA